MPRAVERRGHAAQQWARVVASDDDTRSSYHAGRRDRQYRRGFRSKMAPARHPRATVPEAATQGAAGGVDSTAPENSSSPLESPAR